MNSKPMSGLIKSFWCSLATLKRGSIYETKYFYKSQVSLEEQLLYILVAIINILQQFKDFFSKRCAWFCRIFEFLQTAWILNVTRNRRNVVQQNDAHRSNYQQRSKYCTFWEYRYKNHNKNLGNNITEYRTRMIRQTKTLTQQCVTF